MRRIKLGSDARMKLLYEYKYTCAICKRMLPAAVEVDHFVSGKSLWV